MSDFSLWMSISSILLYCTSAGLITSRLFHHQGPNTKIAIGMAALALLIHLGLLAEGIFADPGQNMSMTNVASLIAWLIGFSMTAASFMLPNIILLPMVYGFSAIVIAMGWLLPDSYLMHIEVRPALLLHISLALIAYGCLMIAFLYAVQLSYINYRLKHKQASLLHSSLPPLMMVEQILFKLLTVGTSILTLSLLSGFVFLDNMFAKESAHKTVLSLVAWGIFALIVIGHHRKGWRGQWITQATVLGAFLLTLAYFGSRFVKEVLLA